MKITEIEAIPIAWGPGFPYAEIVVQVHTDEGITGIGEASLAGQGRGVLGLIDHARDRLIGQDARKIEHIWNDLVHGSFWSTGQVFMSAVAGIDVALWDIKGKALGVPVYELLGGPTRDKVKVYRHLVDGSQEEMVEDALSWKERGFTTLRYCPLKALDEYSMRNWDPHRSIEATIKGTEALRLALGDEVELLLDAHTMFSAAETIVLARALEPYRLFFYEDPVRPFNGQALRQVRQKVALPLATGEQFSHKWEFQPLIEEELIDFLRIDIAHCGGITETKKILAAAEMHGQRSALHYGSMLNNVAGLHIDCAIPNFGIQEWGEYPEMYELFPNAPRAVAGYVERPTGPGLGLEFDVAEARKRPSRDGALPSRYWPDGAVADY